ncbi:hypothetical protein Trydic_g10863 [Trypoxylus dichotomus]
MSQDKFNLLASQQQSPTVEQGVATAPTPPKMTTTVGGEETSDNVIKEEAITTEGQVQCKYTLTVRSGPKKKPEPHLVARRKR